MIAFHHAKHLLQAEAIRWAPSSYKSTLLEVAAPLEEAAQAVSNATQDDELNAVVNCWEIG